MYVTELEQPTVDGGVAHDLDVRGGDRVQLAAVQGLDINHLALDGAHNARHHVVAHSSEPYFLVLGWGRWWGCDCCELGVARGALGRHLHKPNMCRFAQMVSAEK